MRGSRRVPSSGGSTDFSSTLQPEGRGTEQSWRCDSEHVAQLCGQQRNSTTEQGRQIKSSSYLQQGTQYLPHVAFSEHSMKRRAHQVHCAAVSFRILKMLHRTQAIQCNNALQQCHLLPSTCRQATAGRAGAILPGNKQQAKLECGSSE